jgi:hypothetical protein
MVWMVIFIVLMMFWLFGGCWACWDPAKPTYCLGTTIIPWLCVLILGLIVFGALPGGTAVQIR